MLKTGMDHRSLSIVNRKHLTDFREGLLTELLAVLEDIGSEICRRLLPQSCSAVFAVERASAIADYPRVVLRNEY